MNLSYPVCSQLIRSSWYYWLQLHSAMPLDMSCLMYHLQLSQYLSRTPLKVENFEEKASFSHFISILHLLARWKSLDISLSVCMHVSVYILSYDFFWAWGLQCFGANHQHHMFKLKGLCPVFILLTRLDVQQLGLSYFVKIKILLWFLTDSLAWWWQCCGLIFVGTHWCMWPTMCA